MLPQYSKTFIIRSFFFEKWLLIHVLAGPKIKTPLASKLASDFGPFDPGIIILKNRKKGTENHRHYHCKYDQHDHDGRENLSCFFIIHVKQTIHLFLLSIPVRISQLSSAVMPFNSHSSSVPEIYPCFFAFSGILPYWKMILSIIREISFPDM